MGRFTSPYWAWHQTGSTIADFRKDGQLVRAVSHLPNVATSDWQYVKNALENFDLFNGALHLPDSDISYMVANDGRPDDNGNVLVTIRSLEDWKAAGYGAQSFENALVHPASAVFGNTNRTKNFCNTLVEMGDFNIHFLFDCNNINPAFVRPVSFNKNVIYAGCYHGLGRLPGRP